ncbi:HlyD family secretion protein [Candidatus Thermokryptus mobilis]|uniref:HlyD family secretion protein n=1 Tax=Candidatus Thermokryptus mobilis TaxID=1643428 RepID=A0A0S4N1S5_9BACT|nr:HlyD family efflux transporter periplasmic adaptor subunit [Candidatus Thermokryptus mobilis]CUU04134.1 HlyD family secretion protein [Candidatus Thermokryptus mobilis]
MKKHIFFLLVWLLLNSCSGGKGDKDLKIYASGVVEAREVIVSSEVSGRIIELNFDEGSRVDSGFVLCRVDTEMIYQRYLEAKSQAEALLLQYQLLLKGARREEIEAMEQAVERARVNFENTKKHFERIKKLYEENVATQEQFDNARTLYESSKSQYEEAVKKLEILKSGAREEEIKIAFANYQRALAQMKSVELQIKKSKILSPISGFVTTKFVELGEFVSPGVPIAKISNLDEVYIRIYLPESELGFVKLGDSVDVKIDSYPKRVFKGMVVFVSPRAEFTPKNVQTKEERTKLVYAVKVKVRNEKGIFKPGMPADVEIIK